MEDSILIDNTWATQFEVHKKVGTKHYELLPVFLRLFYLLQEFAAWWHHDDSKIPGRLPLDEAQTVSSLFDKLS